MQKGFTLFEVLAVLGLLLALGTPTFIRWRDSSSIRQAQAVIAAEIFMVRATAKEMNAPQSVTWTSATFGGQFLNGVTLSTAPQTIMYRQPHGTLQEVAGRLPTYGLTLTKGTWSGAVHIGGVFGQATVQTVN